MAAKKLHFLGVAGYTMRGIAVAAVELGYAVTGTDADAYPPGSDWLDEHGLTWWRQPDAAHVEGVDTVIISGGTPTDDVELVAAQKQGIPIVSYAEFVGGLVATKRRIVVAGTHGKTTVTSLIAWLLESGGLHPDFLIGIQPHNFDSSVRISDSKVMVLEGDEYKASVLEERSKFDYYRPDVLVATSLEMDHPDLFKSVAEIEGRFAALAQGLPAAGRLLYWSGSKQLAEIAKEVGSRAESYGDVGTWHSEHVQLGPVGLSFDLYRGDDHQGHVTAPLYGRHNVDNVTAAVVAALGEGLSIEQIQTGLNDFRGVARRFEVVSAPQAKITVIDDYAHHPTEIAAVIAAAKQHFGRRVVAVVRPHTYSRVHELLGGYRTAVATADLAFVTEIEGAREAGGAAVVSGEDIARDNGDHVFFGPDRARLVERVVEAAKPGDVVVCMTVSGYDGLAAELAERTAKI